MSATEPEDRPRSHHRRLWLRATLSLSRREAVSSALMTSACDNFLNAFAIHLRASVAQIGWLTALPQLVGAAVQLLSIWLGAHIARRRLIVITAVLQSVVLGLLAALAVSSTGRAVHWLIVLAVCYHAALELIQPHWRAWMGSVIPPRRRGAFFAGRTRLTMLTSTLVFIGGGVVLTLGERFGLAWLGFATLFLVAAGGRAMSARYLARMHDPDAAVPEPSPQPLGRTLRAFRHSLHDRTFRRYSLFLAAMRGVVAMAGPFFAVYMLRDLQFTYFQFSINTLASVVVQFLTLAYWGRISDRLGNRLVMISTSLMIPLLPVLWTLSPNFYYLLLVQALSGVAWGGFTLSTANYLYDIRPHRADFATYAAVQSGLSAALIFLGAVSGGYLATALPSLLARLEIGADLKSPLLVLFWISAVFRLAVALWFIPRAVEPDIRRRPALLELVFRIARFNPVSGVTLDWLTVTRKNRGKAAEPSAARDSERSE